MVKLLIIACLYSYIAVSNVTLYEKTMSQPASWLSNNKKAKQTVIQYYSNLRVALTTQCE